LLGIDLGALAVLIAYWDWRDADPLEAVNRRRRWGSKY
jgi:hypothetical protein